MNRAFESDTALAPKKPQIWEKIPITDLEAADFQVFEDGVEQVVQSATLEGPFVHDVHDSAGEHYEDEGTGPGRWIYPDLPNDGNVHVAFLFRNYLISYTPPPSAEGSCHKVTIKVKHNPDAWVAGFDRYCRIPVSSTDPLNGTDFGLKMQNDLLSWKKGKIELSLSAATLFADAHTSRVYLALEFPWKNLNWKEEDTGLYETIGLIARFFDPDGTEAARFSAFDCCDHSNGMVSDTWTVLAPMSYPDVVQVPTRYETQFDVTSSDYDLRIVFSDGVEFGRAETPLKVTSPDGHQFTLSDVGLAKRTRPAQPHPPTSSDKEMGNYIPLVSKGAEYSLAAGSTFHSGQPFYYFFEICEPQINASPAPAVHASLRILDAKTNEVKTERLNFDVSSYIIPGNPIIPIGDTIDISKLPPGNYRLEVQATDSAGQSTPWHSVSFTIQ